MTELSLLLFDGVCYLLWEGVTMVEPEGIFVASIVDALEESAVNARGFLCKKIREEPIPSCFVAYFQPRTFP